MTERMGRLVSALVRLDRHVGRYAFGVAIATAIIAGGAAG